jgi:hypothetical protein
MHCDADEQCGEGAMCGLNRGWIRSCFPKRCQEFRYSPDRVRPVDGVPAKHDGAIVIDAGVAFDPGGWGKRCQTNAECAEPAAACSKFIYPAGLPICERECRTDAVCGEGAYCSYTSVRGFAMCLPRSPEPSHRAARGQPKQLDRCRVKGTLVEPGRNEHGVGLACTTTADCGSKAGAVCGRELTALARKPDTCTRACAVDADCGHNAVCVDMEQGLPAKAKPPVGGSRWCVAACWAI